MITMIIKNLNVTLYEQDTYIADLESSIDNAQFLISEYRYDMSFEEFSHCMKVKAFNTELLVAAKARAAIIKANHRGGRSKSDNITLADAKAMGIRTHKIKQVKPKLVQAGAQGTGKRK